LTRDRELDVVARLPIGDDGAVAPDASREPTIPGPDRVTMFKRALVKHCPVCGQRHLFRRWFQLVERCPRCGLRFVREEGHRVGDFGLNVVVTFAALLVTLLVFSLVTWPELPVGPALLTAAAVVIIVPLVFYPWSRMLWLAFDLSVNPLREGEVTLTT
jgi:uncharacterized protein (DUF983 family)